VLFDDITARKRAEEKLQESERRFRAIFDQTFQFIGLMTPDGILVEANRSALAFAGIREADVLGKPFWETPWWTHSSELQDKLRSAVEAASQGRLVRFEATHLAADGSMHYIDFSLKPVKDENGRVVLLIPEGRDITDRKRAEERLEHLTRVLRAVRSVDRLITREKSRDRLLEGACEDLVKYRGYYNAWIALLEENGCLISAAESGIGREFTPFLERLKHGDLPPCARKAAEQPGVVVVGNHESGCVACHLAERHHAKGAMTVRLEYGGKRYGLISVAVPADFAVDEEECSLFSELARDIAFALYGLGLEEARRKAEETLRKTARELKRSNDDLEQFAYLASHDLQEPLRMVASYLQLLERRYREKLGTDAGEFIDYAVEGATRMKRLINDLLEYSKVGTAERPFEPTQSLEALEEALANLQVAISESGAKVTHGPLPAVTADRKQLVQLFQNLVGNAIKFRSAAPPRVHVAAQMERGEWVFSVRDNGIGIDPKFADRIFIIFQRLHGREEYPGTGIGLALCRKIVERHGGRIWVEPGPGGGSVFFFTVPLRSA
jgi:PAS domain S-box-containing protein